MSKPALLKATANRNYQVYLYYDNGEVRVYECTWAREAEGYCDALRDVSVFVESCKVLNGSLFFDIFNTGDPDDGVFLEADAIYDCSVPDPGNC